MKSALGIIGLLLALAIVGLQMKGQVKTLAPAPEPSQNIQNDMKAQVNAAMQAPRPDGEGKVEAEGK